MEIKSLAIGVAAFALGAGFDAAMLASNAQGRHDRTDPPVYVVSLFETSIDMNTNYPSLAPATFQPFGGRYVVHGGKMVAFEGQPPGQYVVVVFDSMAKVQAWRASDAFKQMYDRYKIGGLRVFAVEGAAQ